ncbi:Hypothetical protein D9617_54g000260 [Elsinoe fawcettii]|nr:Hypothetical protein D9617_54g000260 [Elsinoe fawcettii]
MDEPSPSFDFESHASAIDNLWANITSLFGERLTGDIIESLCAQLLTSIEPMLALSSLPPYYRARYTLLAVWVRDNVSEEEVQSAIETGQEVIATAKKAMGKKKEVKLEKGKLVKKVKVEKQEGKWLAGMEGLTVKRLEWLESSVALQKICLADRKREREGEERRLAVLKGKQQE